MTVHFDDLVDTLFEVLEQPAYPPRVPEITPEGIRRQPCACCGRPARVSFHDLKRRQRTLLCSTCHPPAVTPAPTD
jgi:hypothetical protein